MDEQKPLVSNSAKSNTIYKTPDAVPPDDQGRKKSTFLHIPAGFEAGKFVAKHLKEQQPKVFDTFYPKMYQDLADYHSPREVAGWLGWSALQFVNYGVEKSPSAVKLLTPALGGLVAKGMPTFFLDRNFLEALKRTDFKDEIDWTTMKLPYEEGIMILPRKAFIHPKDGEVSFIVWSRLKEGDYTFPFSKQPHAKVIHVKKETFAIVAMTGRDGVWYDSCLSTEFRPTLKLNNMFYLAKDDEIPPDNSTDSVFDEPLTEVDLPFVEQMGIIVFGTLLALLAKPTLLTKGEKGKTIVKGDTKREWWTPNIVGRGYQTRREPGDGSHASPRMHWRRGHFRDQAHGAGRALRKQIWLEPTLVNATGEDGEVATT